MLGRIEVHDKALLELIPVNATPVRIAGGFGFTEGPVWCREHLLFSDIRRNRTVRWRELPQGPEVTTYRTDTAKGNGLTLDLSGRLLTCEGGARRVSVMDANGDSHTLIDKYKARGSTGPTTSSWVLTATSISQTPLGRSQIGPREGTDFQRCLQIYAGRFVDSSCRRL